MANPNKNKKWYLGTPFNGSTLILNPGPEPEPEAIEDMSGNPMTGMDGEALTPMES